MLLSKLKLVTAGVLASALIGVGLTSYRGEAGEPRDPAARVFIKAPVPKVAAGGAILVWVDEKPMLLKADGTELPSPDPIAKVHTSGSADAQLSRDGKRVAFQYRDNNHRGTLRIFDLAGKTEMTVLDTVRLNSLNWMADGKTLYVRGYEDGGDGSLANWICDPVTQKRTPLKVPKDFFVRALSPDGKTSVVDEWKMSADTWHQRAHLWTLGTGEPTALLELNQSFDNLTPQFSPDGKRLLCKVKHYGSYKPLGSGSLDRTDFKFNDLLEIDLATKKRTVVKELGEKPEWRIAGFAWSPDGGRIAYVETKSLPRPPGQSADAFRVTVCDPDGRNAKVIHTAEGSWLVGFDWK